MPTDGVKNSVKPGILPDLSSFPDCKERRDLENLQQELDIVLQEMTGADDQRLKDLWTQGNNIWWKANALMGALVARVADAQGERRRWMVTTVISAGALLISLVALAVAIIAL